MTQTSALQQQHNVQRYEAGKPYQNTPKVYGLFIAYGSYRWQPGFEKYKPLETPPADATSVKQLWMSSKLNIKEENVFLLIEPHKEALEARMEEVAGMIKGCGPNQSQPALIIMYYSGHGCSINGQLNICVPHHQGGGYIDLKYWTKRFTEHEHTLLFNMFDCCRETMRGDMGALYQRTVDEHQKNTIDTKQKELSCEGEDYTLYAKRDGDLATVSGGSSLSDFTKKWLKHMNKHSNAFYPASLDSWKVDPGDRHEKEGATVKQLILQGEFKLPREWSLWVVFLLTALIAGLTWYLVDRYRVDPDSYEGQLQRQTEQLMDWVDTVGALTPDTPIDTVRKAPYYDRIPYGGLDGLTWSTTASRDHIPCNGGLADEIGGWCAASFDDTRIKNRETDWVTLRVAFPNMVARWIKGVEIQTLQYYEDQTAPLSAIEHCNFEYTLDGNSWLPIDDGKRFATKLDEFDEKHAIFFNTPVLARQIRINIEKQDVLNWATGRFGLLIGGVQFLQEHHKATPEQLEQAHFSTSE